MKKEIKYIDLFSGIGGFRLGLDKLNLKCVMSSDIDKNCRKVYKENFNDKPYGDIHEVSEFIVPDHNILTGGFPCQPFSICGKQKGFKDDRGNLFYEIIRIVNFKRPKVVFLENVKHLKNHDGGNTLSVIIDTLEGLGYKTSWKVLNGKDFGVPQNRERIIIVSSMEKYFDFSKVKNLDTLKIKDILEEKGDFEYLNNEEYTILDNEIVKTQKSGLRFIGYRNKKIRDKGTRPNTEHLSRVHKQPNRIYCSEGTHPTIPSQETSGRFWIYHQEKVRKLTLKECYRLNGFPSDFKNSSTKGEQYKQIGNSVVIPMITEIGREIVNQFFKE
ncbi:DNA cytosine methyltransferase [Arcobacter suis]|uniref:Cytosine-specific methyltransferase n=1 Tax=Arcobacter suis CECT 7833 TaxID=663365 RepID=A0AAD0WQ97_9BACT|nr:DNA (cytosine-5-)-methyltransferase [Arcobacter suis]AXX89519.1 type II cytosine-specific DNA methyltransferase [Arcobacter suis CECT 7833]